jgi:hypothetical protein
MIVNSQLLGAQIEIVETLPVSGKFGQLVFLESNETIYIWKGTAWSSVATDADLGGFQPVFIDDTDSPLVADVGDKGNTYLVDTTNGAITFQLPAPIVGMWFSFKDVGGSLSTNPVTLTRAASEKIEDLAANYALEANYGTWTVGTDGTDWFLL